MIDLVERSMGCPGCGNREVDKLVFIDDAGNVVECQNCKLRYRPLDKHPLDQNIVEYLWFEQDIENRRNREMVRGR